MRIPERLVPASIWRLFQTGIVDVGALLCYAAAILVIALIIWWLRRRSMASRIALAVAVAALGMTSAFSGWDDRVPPVFWDISKAQITAPSEGVVERIAAFDEPVHTILYAPHGQWDARLVAAMRNLCQDGKLSFRTWQADESGTAFPIEPNTLNVTRGGAGTRIPYDRLIVTNPAAPEGETRQWLNLESELLQAVELIHSSRPSIYRLAGPEDASRPTVLMDAVRRITADALTPLNLDQAVPEDCTFIIIDNPQQDLTAQQASLLRSYLGRGGRLLLITDYIYGAMPNLNSALEEYGLVAIDGVVFDPGAAMGGRPEYPMPELSADHVIGRWLQAPGRMPLMPLSHGILVREIKGVDGVALLTTTGEAYCQLSGIEHTSLDRGDQDPQGPFCLAAAAQSGNGKVVWVASADMMTLEADADVGGANADLLLASMRWLMDAQAEPVPAKAIE